MNLSRSRKKEASSKIVGCKTSALVVTADNEYKENNVNVIRINDGEGVFIDGGVHICKV